MPLILKFEPFLMQISVPVKGWHVLVCISLFYQYVNKYSPESCPKWQNPLLLDTGCNVPIQKWRRAL